MYQALDHKDAGDDNLVLVGRMPKFVRDLTQLDGDFYIYRDHTYENIKTEKEAKEEGRFSPGKDYHGVGEADYVQAVMDIERPVITINDTKDGSNPEIVMVLPTVGRYGTPLTATIGLYKDRPINGVWQKKPHITLSVYERLEGQKNRSGSYYPSLSEIVNDAVKNERVVSFDKEMSDGLPVIAEISSLGNITASSLNSNVA